MIEIDQDTFKVMWELSAPGGDAEECFMRIPQEEYYIDHRDTLLDWMPDVSYLPVYNYHHLLTSNSCNDSSRLLQRSLSRRDHTGACHSPHSQSTLLDIWLTFYLASSHEGEP